MTKSDLRTGHIVTLRNGEEYVVLLNCNTDFESGDFIVNAKKQSWNNLSCYQEDLTCRYTDEDNIEEIIPEWDIVRVELPSHPYTIQNFDFERKIRKLLWERSESLSHNAPIL